MFNAEELWQDLKNFVRPPVKAVALFGRSDSVQQIFSIVGTKK